MNFVTSLVNMNQPMVRELMAKLGFRRFHEMIGRVDKLDMVRAIAHWKAKGIDLTRLLHRARHTAVPATRGGGMHPNREVWVRNVRQAEPSGFVPRNKHRPA